MLLSSIVRRTVLLRRAFSSPPPTLDGGFMNVARVNGATALLGLLRTSSTRFDSCLSGLEVTSIQSGRVTCTLTVTESLSNSYGTLHGGAAALLIDVAGTLAALSVDPTRPGVSVEMSQTFLRPAPLGLMLFIEGKCLKSGKKLAFTDVEIRANTFDGHLIVVGQHTKAL
jgi:acyl-coenzyme A thioesterase 13